MMSELKTSNPASLRFLMSEDIYALNEPEIIQQPVNSLTEEGKAEEAAPAAPEAIAPSQSIAFDYLGENNRYILLLVNSAGYSFLPPKELEALQSTIQAKKMDMKDVALVNLAKYPPVTWQQLKDYFACSTIVLFGISPETLKMNGITFNTIHSFEGLKVLATFSYTEMLESNDKKRAFWNEMKKI